MPHTLRIVAIFVVVILLVLPIFIVVPNRKNKTSSEIKISQWKNAESFGEAIICVVMVYKLGFIPTLFIILGLGLIYRSKLEAKKLNIEKSTDMRTK